MTTIRDFITKNQETLGAVFVPIPIVIYWAYWTLHPSYWFNADPAALYFIDSLSVFIGKSYEYVDHPGTPVQVIGSLLLAVTYPFFESRDAFVNFFLARPGAFFLMAHVFLLAANVFCAVVFYKTVTSALKQNRVISAISVSLLFFALHPYSYQSLTLWSHNSLNFPIGTLLLVWIYRELRKSQEIKPGKLIAMGFACGVFATAQMYFLAWLVSGIFIVALFTLRLGKGFMRALTAGAWTAVGGVLGITSMLIPIHRELPRFMNWLGEIVMHQGIYGSGESGIFSFSMVLAGMAFWWATIRPMISILVFVLLTLGIFAWFRRNARPQLEAGDFAMTVGLLFHIALVLLLMVKATIKLRYSLSLAASLPVLIFLVLKLIETTNWRVGKMVTLLFLLAIAGVFLSLPSQFAEIDKRALVEEKAQAAKTKAVNKISRQTGVPEEEVVVVYAFSVPLKCAGLLHASNWTGYFKEELSEICPNQYAIWDSNIELNTAVPVIKITEIDWDLVIWPGNGSDLPDYLYSVGSVNVPRSWHVEYSKWFFIHSEILEE
ncbi:MAG: hypothetical protein C3F07_00360 [Anaerolineales bacterium]|nr:MAG: hypothetical protein C3F07_00360 [Anaerolineales bacterium]